MGSERNQSSVREDASRLLAEAQRAFEAMRISDALALFDRAEQTSGNADACAGGRWKCYMLRGEFEKAWQESDAIARRASPDPQRFWDGQSLSGKRVLIRCLHGLGDTIQFIRYAPLLRDQARHLTIEAQPSLRRLLAASCLADTVITWGDPEGEWDLQVEVVELPRIFRTTLSSIPNHVPYLRIEADLHDGATRHALFGSRRAGPLHVGLVWRSSAFDPSRSIGPERIAELFETQGVRFFNAQTGPEMIELSDWKASVPMLHTEGDDILATAVKLQDLDLVITVDTMVAHLAGALGKPVWVLLPFQCDWRWMLYRTDSPWYPTMQLFRQLAPGDWSSVIEMLQHRLNITVAEHRASTDLLRLPVRAS